jgi:hypothetical protein
VDVEYTERNVDVLLCRWSFIGFAYCPVSRVHSPHARDESRFLLYGICGLHSSKMYVDVTSLQERWDGVMWTGLVWLRIGTGGELL